MQVPTGMLTNCRGCATGDHLAAPFAGASDGPQNYADVKWGADKQVLQHGNCQKHNTAKNARSRPPFTTTVYVPCLWHICAHSVLKQTNSGRSPCLGCAAFQLLADLLITPLML